MTIRYAFQHVKSKFVVILFGALVVVPNVMAIETTKFFAGFDENEDDLVRAVSIQYDATSISLGTSCFRKNIRAC